MNDHVTYTRTQGHKSLGPPIKGNSQQGFLVHKAFGKMKMKWKRRKRREIRQEMDKTMAIQEDQDGDIWSTI
jgi:hypothetical protein